MLEAAKMPADVVVKRLHVGGLTDQITTKDLAERFARYGKVDAVEAPGPDGLGEPRRFAYLTLTATPQDIRKCIGSMQGGVWRGAKLKIAEAKPRWDQPVVPQELTAEQQKALERKVKRRKTKVRERRLAAVNGNRQTGDMSLVNEANFDGPYKKHWRAASDHRLVRPIFTRPTHPISMHSDAGLGKREKSRSSAPTRARRTYLDPVRYGSRHATEDALERAAGRSRVEYTAINDGSWEFVYDSSDGESGSGRWCLRTQSGSRDIERIAGKRRRVDAALDDIAANSIYPDTLIIPASPRAKARKQPAKVLPVEEDEAVFLDDDDLWGAAPDVTTTREASPLFESRPVPTTRTPPVVTKAAFPEAVLGGDELFGNSATPAQTGSSPLFPAKDPTDAGLFDDGSDLSRPSSPELFRARAASRSPSMTSSNAESLPSSSPVIAAAPEDDFDFSDPSYLALVSKEKSSGLDVLAKVDVEEIALGPDSPYSSDTGSHERSSSEPDVAMSGETIATAAVNATAEPSDDHGQRSAGPVTSHSHAQETGASEERGSNDGEEEDEEEEEEQAEQGGDQAHDDSPDDSDDGSDDDSDDSEDSDDDSSDDSSDSDSDDSSDDEKESGDKAGPAKVSAQPLKRSLKDVFAANAEEGEPCHLADHSIKLTILF